MNRYQIDAWYASRVGLVDNLVITLRRNGYSAYTEDTDIVVTNASRPAMLITSGYGQLLKPARS